MVKLTLNILVLSLLLLCLATADNPPNMANRRIVCTQPRDYGNCSEMQTRWYFSTKANKCKPFRYSGCGGNANLFVWRTECIKYCVSPDYDT